SQRRAAVDVRLAPAEEVEVRSMQDQQLDHGWNRLTGATVSRGRLCGSGRAFASELGDAFELALEEAHHGRVVRRGELVVDRPDFSAHASNLGRGDVVVDHAFCLEL